MNIFVALILQIYFWSGPGSGYGSAFVKVDLTDTTSNSNSDIYVYAENNSIFLKGSFFDRPITQLIVVDILGRTVFNRSHLPISEQGFQIPNTFSDGTYIIRVVRNDGTSIVRKAILF